MTEQERLINELAALMASRGRVGPWPSTVAEKAIEEIIKLAAENAALEERIERKNKLIASLVDRLNVESSKPAKDGEA